MRIDMDGAARRRAGRDGAVPHHDLVARLRTRKGDMTNVELGRVLGMSEGMVRNVLNGDMRPGLETISRLVVWDPAQFEQPVMAYLRDVGRQLLPRTEAPAA